MCRRIIISYQLVLPKIEDILALLHESTGLDIIYKNNNFSSSILKEDIDTEMC